MQVYRTPILTLDPNAKAGGGLIEVVKYSDVKTLRDERDRLRLALEAAGDAICSEYCGAGPCHKKCLAVKAALTPAGGGQDGQHGRR